MTYVYFAEEFPLEQDVFQGYSIQSLFGGSSDTISGLSGVMFLSLVRISGSPVLYIVIHGL